jgi:hypothetical protein
MNNYEEIKFLVEASRKALNKKSLKEDIEIKKYYGLLTEQPYENSKTENDENNFENDEIKMFGEDNPTDKEKRSFKIKGNTLSIYGKLKSELQLTLDEKIAFQEGIDEFRNDVAELVDFNVLNVYSNNVEWSGLITDRNIEFFFSVSETDGVYIKGDMIKLDDDFIELVEKLKKYYSKFKIKWSKIIGSRKETKK